MSEQHISEEQFWEIVDGGALNDTEQQHLDSCLRCQKHLKLVSIFEYELKALPQMKPSIGFSAEIVKQRNELIGSPWFVSIVGGIFSVVFGLSVYAAVEAGIQLANTWVHIFSFTLVVLALMYLELRWRLKSTTKFV